MVSAVEPIVDAEDFVNRLIKDYDLWASNCFMIRDKGNELIPLETNDVQKEIGRVEEEELALNGNARIFVLKARQAGISTDQQARNLHCVWGRPGARALTLAHAREDTDKIFEITRRAIQNFPPELLPTIGRSESKEITFPGIDSAFWTGTAGASRVGRGITLTRFHGSEFAFWKNPRGTLGALSPAMIPQGSVIVLESTPDAYDSEAHKFWKESVAGETGYRPLFFPWWKCDPRHYRMPLLSDGELGVLSDEEKSLVTQEGLSHEQIKWRRKKIKEMGRSEFLREYAEDAETCWMTAGNKFYDSDKISILLRVAPTIITSAEIKKKDYGGAVKVFATRALTTRQGIIYEDVIMGSDCAEGTGGPSDKSTWVARSWPSWRLLSTFGSSKIQPEEFAYLLGRWASEEYGNALLVIEKNFHGITVLRTLRDKIKYPRKHIYHRTPLGQNYDTKTDYIGWTTTAESKPLMLDHGHAIINSATDGYITPPSREALIDALAVTDGVLTGRDIWVAEILAWIGREYQAKRRVKAMRPLHY